MIMDEIEGAWVYRKNHKINSPKTSVFSCFKDDVPALKPEIQLLYKSKNPREKDELDFSKTIPTLEKDQRRWLSDCLQLCYPKGHPWLDSIERL